MRSAVLQGEVDLLMITIARVSSLVLSLPSCVCTFIIDGLFFLSDFSSYKTQGRYKIRHAWLFPLLIALACSLAGLLFVPIPFSPVPRSFVLSFPYAFTLLSFIVHYSTRRFQQQPASANHNNITLFPYFLHPFFL